MSMKTTIIKARISVVEESRDKRVVTKDGEKRILNTGRIQSYTNFSKKVLRGI